MALTIGLTGGIAAGKSEALGAFRATRRSDDLQRRRRPQAAGLRTAARPPRRALGPRSGARRPGKSRSHRRDRLRRPQQLSWLEAQVHPLVGERIGEWLGALPAAVEVAVVEVPLLFEAEMEGAFDTTVAVVAAEEVRRSRAMARGQALVGEREVRQLPQAEKAARAERLIRNDGTLEDLEDSLSALIETLKG